MTRYVGRLLTHWMGLYPMAEYVAPEEALDRIVSELRMLRAVAKNKESK